MESVEMDEVLSTRLIVVNEKGIHARPASLIARAVGEFDACVTLIKGEQNADTHSVLSILMLAATEGTELLGEATGNEREEALAALQRLFEGGFQDE
jgi:phosphotransferase system HPr (HPr) family protein